MPGKRQNITVSKLVRRGVVRWIVNRVEDGARRRTIFVTGGAFMPRAQELVATVTNTVLEKPFDLSRLRSLIGNLAHS